jgi:hypothetical protein
MRAITILLLCFLPTIAAAQAASAQVDTTAAVLVRGSMRTSSLEVLGQDVLSQALRLAAARPPADRARGITVMVPVTLRTFVRPRVPSPSEIDVCWETASGIHSYIECSAPDFRPDPRPISICDDLWRQYRAATNLATRRSLLIQLLASDCIELRTARVERRQVP